MKTALVILLILHGLIHLPGFLKAYQIVAFEQLSLPIGKTAGVFWLLAALLFLLAALAFLAGNTLWWLPATAAVAISQVLILGSWSDARYGTVLNILIALMIAGGFGMWKFHQSYRNDFKAGLLRQHHNTPAVVTEADLVHLPEPVQKYLRYSGVVGQPRINSIKINMDGRMREKGKDWFSFTSEQYNFFDIPARLFYMTGKIKGIDVPGYHRYLNGTASMRIRLFGLFPVVEQEGVKLDQAETVTLFNDICLLAPAALTDKRISWSEGDSLSCLATFRVNKISISAKLIFNEQGQLINFISDDRYALKGDGMQQFRFSTPVKAYRIVNGFPQVSEGSAVWHYPDGEFEYGQFYIRSIEYNCK